MNEKLSEGERFCCFVPYIPGLRTLKNFLAAALAPVGKALYIYGGGWNMENTGGSVETEQIGLADSWLSFFEEQDACFSYRPMEECERSCCGAVNYYPSDGRNRYGYAGLDCSGYVGWAVYNTMENVGGRGSYVTRASAMAYDYAKRYGWGTFCGSHPDCGRLRPGDIYSIDGHVWICVGTCRDGSVVILHSTPSPSRLGCPGGGVQLGALGDREECEAYRLADFYMTRYYPKWSGRYRTALKDMDVYTASDCPGCGRFRWYRDERGLPDPDGIWSLEAGEALERLYGGAVCTDYPHF